MSKTFGSYKWGSKVCNKRKKNCTLVMVVGRSDVPPSDGLDQCALPGTLTTLWGSFDWSVTIHTNIRLVSIITKLTIFVNIYKKVSFNEIL